MSMGMAEPKTQVTPDAQPAAEPAPLPPEPPRHGLHWTGRAALAAAPLAFVALAWGTGVYLHSQLAPEPPTELVAAPPASETGYELYQRHCASCHGVKGDGRGHAGLDPRARFFGGEKFKFATTDNGIPTDDDLLRVIKSGVPGTAMPSFAFLTEDQSRAVVAHVRRLAWRGTYDSIYAKRMEEYNTGDGDLPVPAKIAREADKLTKPGDPLTPPAPPPATAESIARGRKVYEKTCQSCHGPTGHGDGPQVKDLKDEYKYPIRPRDLTRGIFKGGSEWGSIYVRVMHGIPGTPMPKMLLKDPAKPNDPNPTPAEVYDLVNYVMSLSEPPSAAKAPAAVMVAAPPKR